MPIEENIEKIVSKNVFFYYVSQKGNPKKLYEFTKSNLTHLRKDKQWKRLFCMHKKSIKLHLDQYLHLSLQYFKGEILMSKN